MRVTIVTDGLEPLLHDTAVGLADRGHTVRVIGAWPDDRLDPEARFRVGSRVSVEPWPADDPGPGGLCRSAGAFARAVTANGGAVRDAARRLAGSGSVGDRARSLRRILPLLGDDADVVYIEAAYLAAELATTFDRLPPTMVMCTGSDVRVLPDLQPELARRLPLVLVQAAQVCCRSDDLREWAIRRGAPPGRTRVLRSAVDRSLFAPSARPGRDDGVLRLLSVGRLHWVKGFDRAVEAVARARDRGASVHYTILGPDGGAEDPIDIAIRDLGLEDDVVRVGPASRAGVRAAMARADALLVSSVSEGISRAAGEAMATGLPVISTDVGGMAELVTDGSDGLLVAPRDTEALSEAILALASDPDRVASMARAAARTGAAAAGELHLDRLEAVLVEAAAAGAQPS